MASSLELHSVLKAILGSTNVYYQPPSSVIMKYPAIVFSRSNISSKYANDKVYGTETTYQLTIIDKDPDSILIGKVAQLPTCRFSTHFTKDNLNHDIFTINY